MKKKSNIPAWTEADSVNFIDSGRIYTPRRDELQQAFLDAIPAEPNDSFLAVDIGSGAGWLTAAILQNFPHSRVVALDGSPTMRTATVRASSSWSERLEVRAFQLEERLWRDELQDDIRVIVSSLVIHHLRGAEKQRLFADLLPHLQSAGALLMADVMAPASESVRRHFARAWSSDVTRQSFEETGSDKVAQQFETDSWNFYAWPDEEDDIDFPSTTVEQIDWLREAGYQEVDVLWSRAGHSLLTATNP